MHVTMSGALPTRRPPHVKTFESFIEPPRFPLQFKRIGDIQREKKDARMKALNLNPANVISRGRIGRFKRKSFTKDDSSKVGANFTARLQ